MDKNVTWFSSPRLRLGVTGHRLNQLPEAAHPKVRAAIDRALEEAAAAALQAGHGHSKLLLISALAEGADRIAAHAALARHWRMISPLPFKRARYEEDFPDSVDEFRALYRRAVARHEIDGEKLAAEHGVSAAGYAAVGREIVAHSDVLLAVWNGKPPKGPGGTAEVCALALQKGAPVLWIDADGNGPKLILPAAKPRPERFRARLFDALAARFEKTSQPAEMRVADPPAAA
jgi:hypothetical protein